MTFDLCRVIDLFLYLFGFLQFRVVYNVTALFGSGYILLSRMGRKVELWELMVVKLGVVTVREGLRVWLWLSKGEKGVC